ncbi:MAG: LptF/LptG family permease [Saprospiraceae bacterium]|nr:LptF/LptG family permease [Saprospiraceae bacterium]
MKKIYTFILKSYLGPFVMTFFIALFILLLQFLWKYIDDLVGKGLEWYILAKLLFYMSSTFVPLALPLAILLSSLMTFGNLGENYELVAAKAAGISLRKTMQPLVILSILISISAFYFANNVMPIANLKARSLLYDVQQQKPTVNIKPGVFYNEIDNYTIRIGKKEKDGMNISNIMIYDHSDRKGNINLTVAQYGKMEFTPDNRYLIFTLHNGYNYYESINNRRQRQTRPFQRTKFKEEIRRIDLSSFAFQKTDEELFKDHYQMLNISQLQNALDSLAIYKDDKYEEFSEFILNSFYFYRTINAKIIADTIKNKDSIIIEAKNKTKKIDSVNKRNEVIKKLKDRGFPKAQLSKLRHTEDEYPVATDTLLPTIFNFDKKLKNDYLSNFNKTEKINIIESALNSARNINSHIDWTKSDLEANTRYISKHKIEWHRKFALSFACFVLFFIGAPLGAIIRKGGLGLPVVVSVIFFVIFHIISITGEKAAKEGVIDPIYGMWLASAVLLPIGIFLTIKATTDSALLDTDSWKKFFMKLIGKKTK